MFQLFWGQLYKVIQVYVIDSTFVLFDFIDWPLVLMRGWEPSSDDVLVLRALTLHLTWNQKIFGYFLHLLKAEISFISPRSSSFNKTFDLVKLWQKISSAFGGHIRVIRMVRKTQHQKNPEFGHTQGEIQKKKTCKKVH